MLDSVPASETFGDWTFQVEESWAASDTLTILVLLLELFR